MLSASMQCRITRQHNFEPDKKVMDDDQISFQISRNLTLPCRESPIRFAVQQRNGLIPTRLTYDTKEVTECPASQNEEPTPSQRQRVIQEEPP